MKKIFSIIAVAAMVMTASAQTKVTLNTYSGTAVDKYAGMQCDVTMNRYLFTGWNTVALPFDMSEQDLDAVLGQGWQLERLVGVNQQGSVVELCFQECKAEGVKAGVPYILYYAGETGTKKFLVNTRLTPDYSPLTFTTEAGVQVTMSGAALKAQGKGKYGILALHNAEARFTRVDSEDNVFYATRCYITTSTQQPLTMVARHLGANEVTGITDIVAGSDVVDVYNIQGMKVASGVRAAHVNNLVPNVYIVNGRKVIVR